MIRPVARSFALAIAAIMPVALVAGPVAGQDDTPSVTTVFGEQRTSDTDIVHVRNGDVLRGDLLADAFSIETPYGTVTLDRDDCAGLSFDDSGGLTIIAVNRNRLTGTAKTDPIRFRLASAGTELTLTPDKLERIIVRRGAGEAARAGSGANLFIMSNGDVLTGQTDTRQVSVETSYGVMEIKVGDIASYEKTADGATITMANGDVMRGSLATGTIAVVLDLGPRIDALDTALIQKVVFDASPDDIAAHLGAGGASGGGKPSSGEPNPPEPFTNSIGIEFIWVPPGEFTMGSPEDEENREGDERPHRVKLTRGFYLARTETTQAQWNALMGENPHLRWWKGDNLPVTEVSWDDAVEFCKKLSETEGRVYRLPTEAQWEYACRAGAPGPFPEGLTVDDVAWYVENSDDRYREVATKAPNAWGFHDMHGNVREWCRDIYEHYPPGSVTDPSGPSEGNVRVLRGGAWDDVWWICRAAHRSAFHTGDRYNTRGFRIALYPEE